MKKYLLLIRHASAEEPTNSSMKRDFDRNLTSKGTMESARLGKYLASLNLGINQLFSSPSARTMETARYIAEQLKFETDDIQAEEGLFGSGPRNYLALVNSISEIYICVAIVGHNPEVSFFTDYLCQEEVGGSFEKATAVLVSFEDLKWNEISKKTGKIEFRIDVKDIFENE